MSGPFPLAEGALSDGLSGIAEVLGVPVHALVVVALAVLLYEVGRALLEGWQRVRPGQPGVERLALQAMQAPDAADSLARMAPGPVAQRAVRAIGSAVRDRPDQAGRAKGFEKALTRYELDVQRRLDRTRMLVRAGPALGLMGTLIPLAPGLAALGDGDIAQLAADMQVAFAATVLGLVVGTVGFALTLVRTRIYTEDLSALEAALDTWGELQATSGGPVVPDGGTSPAGTGPPASTPAAPVVGPSPAAGWIGRPVHHGPQVEPTNGHHPVAPVGSGWAPPAPSSLGTSGPPSTWTDGAPLRNGPSAPPAASAAHRNGGATR